LLCVLLVLPTWPSIAQTFHISAAYRNGKLTFNTPPAAYCTEWPFLCKGVYSEPDMAFDLSYNKHFVPWRDKRERIYSKLPAPRTGTIMGMGTGGNHNFSFEFVGLALEVVVPPHILNPLVTFGTAGPCKYRAGPEGPSMMVVWFKMSSGVGQCFTNYYPDDGKLPAGNRRVNLKGAAYQLDFPSLKSMKPGVYTGSMRFTVGDGRDIDLGMGASDLGFSTFDVVITLTVHADMLVDFPPDSHRAVLEPPGGWSNWTSGSPAPPQLSRDIPFRITVDGPFSVHLSCGHYGTWARCGLRNQQDHEVRVATYLSIPGAISGGGEAVKVQIYTATAPHQRFELTRALRNSPSTLHFVLESEWVKTMLKYPGSAYEGLVTVIFNAVL